MAKYDFTKLYQQYPSVIRQMPDTFTSHDFILCLAQQNQQLYVEALSAYSDSLYEETPAPFMCVHGILAKRLGECPEIEYIGYVKSKDIFDSLAECASWEKIK